MKDDIGRTAGIVWATLGREGEVSLPQLPRILGMKGEIAYQSLGWLAREGKVVYLTDEKGKIKVTLTAIEKEIYGRSSAG